MLGEGGIASGAPEGTVVVNMSTVDPGVNIRMGEALAPKAYNVAPEVLAGAEVQVGKKKFVRFE